MTRSKHRSKTGHRRRQKRENIWEAGRAKGKNARRLEGEMTECKREKTKSERNTRRRREGTRSKARVNCTQICVSVVSY
jgi:hypothetical protein